MISNDQDVIDSRDVIEAIEDLESQIEDIESQIEDLDEELNNGYDGDFHNDITRLEAELTELRKELEPLTTLAGQADGSPDWTYGETLIRDSYFTTYTQELAEDCCEVPDLSDWPLRHMEMDWEAAASELQSDYTDVDFDGETYWIRS